MPHTKGEGMSGHPYMQLWVADFVGDTLHLSSAEVGQYMLLLMAMWRNGGTLPSDDEKLKRVAREAISEAVMAFFDRTEDGSCITQKRLLAELERARAKTAARREAGSRGGNAKAANVLKNNDAPLAKAVANDVAKPCHLPVPVPLATNVANLDTRKSRNIHELPKDWLPHEGHFSWAEAEGVPRREVERIADDMRYWAWGKGERRKNWDMVLFTFLRRERKGHGPPKNQTAQAFEEIQQEIANGYGNGGFGIRDQRGADAGRQLQKPGSRSQDLRETTDRGLRRPAKMVASEDGSPG